MSSTIIMTTREWTTMLARETKCHSPVQDNSEDLPLVSKFSGSSRVRIFTNSISLHGQIENVPDQVWTDLLLFAELKNSLNCGLSHVLYNEIGSAQYSHLLEYCARFQFCITQIKIPVDGIIVRWLIFSPWNVYVNKFPVVYITYLVFYPTFIWF